MAKQKLRRPLLAFALDSTYIIQIFHNIYTLFKQNLTQFSQKYTYTCLQISAANGSDGTGPKIPLPPLYSTLAHTPQIKIMKMTIDEMTVDLLTLTRSHREAALAYWIG